MSVWPKYLTPQEISEIVEDTRAKYGILADIPVDIEAFAECDLRIDIIPVAGLRGRIKADAEITQDFKSILVDLEYFQNDKMHCRNRFSIAHELGHLFLHRDFFLQNFHSDNVEGWLHCQVAIDDIAFHRLEWQANMFASLMLMPGENVIKAVLSTLTTSLTGLARMFDVSQKAMERRLSADDVSSKLTKHYRL